MLRLKPEIETDTTSWLQALKPSAVNRGSPLAAAARAPGSAFQVFGTKGERTRPWVSLTVWRLAGARPAMTVTSASASPLSASACNRGSDVFLAGTVITACAVRCGGQTPILPSSLPVRRGEYGGGSRPDPTWHGGVKNAFNTAMDSGLGFSCRCRPPGRFAGRPLVSLPANFERATLLLETSTRDATSRRPTPRRLSAGSA